jgi:putative addiction module component (TIGR02574 family)
MLSQSHHFDFSQLSAGERMELAQALLDSVRSELCDAPPSDAWKTEITRRMAEIDSGRVAPIPLSDVQRLFSRNS